MALYNSLNHGRALADLDDRAAARTNLGVVAGEYTITSGDATANLATIASGLSSIASVLVQVIDAGNNVVTADADVTVSAGNIVVADGATYNTVQGYKVRWIAVGTK